MQFEVQNEYRVRALLTDEDLKEMEVSFESLDYRDPETRRFLWQLLYRMREDGIGLKLDGRLLIEAAKAGKACAVSFTVLPDGGDGAPRVYTVGESVPGTCVTAETPADLAAALRQLPEGTPFFLFRCPGGAGAYVSAPVSPALRTRLSEYGRVCTDREGRAKAVIEEYVLKVESEK